MPALRKSKSPLLTPPQSPRAPAEPDRHPPAALPRLPGQVRRSHLASEQHPLGALPEVLADRPGHVVN